MKKKILPVIIIIILIFVLTAAVFLSGILTRPTKAKMASYSEVRSNDILEMQYRRELDILADYEVGSYTIEDPYVIQDPYQANPLSALVLFDTEEPMVSSVSVQGGDEYTTFSFTYEKARTRHEIAVVGLFPNLENLVTITLIGDDGTEKNVDLLLKTEALPYDFPVIEIVETKPEQMEPGVTLMIPCFEMNYTYILDAAGDVRAYFSNKNFGHGTAMRVLQNGRLLATGDVMKMMPYNMYTLWEMNLLGKVFVEYEIPNAVHHDIIELENGDFLATSNNADMPINYDTREDVLVQINRESGMVIEKYDIRSILDENREPYNHFGPGVLNMPNRDWAHLNSAEVDPNDGYLITSSPIQSAVLKFNPENSEIKWLLSSPEGWDGEFADYQQYLLTPIGEGDFEWSWGQHGVKVLEDADGNPDTLDILLLDNGQNRSYTEEGSLKPEENYSRAVIYRINEKDMTVEQLWQYGKERGSEAYSTFLGSADYLPLTGNVLADFGGMLRSDDVPVDSIVDGVLGQQQVESRVVEVNEAAEVIFEVYMTPNNSTSAETYQARRITLYTRGMNYILGEEKGIRLGAVQSTAETELKLPKFFIKRLEINFNQIFEKDGYLITQGNFKYQGETYLIGRLNLVLKNQGNEYIFQGPAGLNGNFYLKIDLSQLETGEYAIFAVGAVIEGNDANGDLKPAYQPTGYKIIVE